MAWGQPPHSDRDTGAVLRTPPSLMPHASKEATLAEGGGHGTSPGDVHKGACEPGRNPRRNLRETPLRAEPELPEGKRREITTDGGVCPPGGPRGRPCAVTRPSLHGPRQLGRQKTQESRLKNALVQYPNK